MMAEELETLVKAPLIRPFVPFTLCRCPMCGRGVPRWSRMIGPIMGRTASSVDFSYCDGGKLPTEEVSGIQAAMMGQTEHVNECAGVNEPHLHVKCRVCDYVWLMKTKG